MGGADKVARQHEFGKLTVRERVERIVDDGSFEEIGAIAGVATYDDDGELQAFLPSNFVCGVAEIDGRPVVVSGDDFTVRGGSADASIGAKRNYAEGLALELRLPARPPGRRHGRRRLGEDHRDGGAQLHLADAGLGDDPGPAVGGAVGVARPRLGRRHRRRPRHDEPLLRDRQGHRPDDDRRTRRSSTTPCPVRTTTRTSWAAATSTSPTAPSTTRPPPRTRPSPWPAGSCPTCPSSVDELPPRAADHRRPGPPRGRARLDRAPQPAPRVQDALDHRGGGRPRRRRLVVVLRDRPAVGQVDHLAAWPGWTAGRSR